MRLLAATLLMVSAPGLADAQAWDVYPDTWGAVDALGRALPDSEAVGPPRSDRYVGMFYFLWLDQHTHTGPWDITKIREANPENPAWGPLHHFHHWGEPERGYYRSDDPWVMRKHIQELADAGVDVLIFDGTNGFPYTDIYNLLFDTMADMRASGNVTPQVAFLANASAAQSVYDDLYAPGNHSDLWFRWEGKPLLMVTSGSIGDLSATLRNFFTVKKTWGLQRLDENDEWSFLQHYPQDVGHSSAAPSENEFMSVSIAQQETYMSYPTAHGRSYHGGAEPPEHLRDDSGQNFAEQWERALSFDPRFIFVTGWNEWVAQRFEDDQGNSRFVDAYSKEFSRDIEPMKDGFSDTYYYQLVSFVRRHKGVRALESASAPGTMSVDGSFADWAGVTPEYRDTRGDTVHRNHPMWGGASNYVNTTGRNDILYSKTAVDAQNVYFHVRCAASLTAPFESNWMLLYIDADNNLATGWEGYDLLVNGRVTNTARTSLQQFSASGARSDLALVDYRVNGSALELAIPREYFESVSEFRFKWADNPDSVTDLAAFSTSGDSAPNRRAFYRVLAEAPPQDRFHAADLDEDRVIDTTELLGIIGLYHAGAYHCAGDGFAAGAGDTACAPHHSDYAPQDWRIGLSELLRLVQFVNAGAYHDCQEQQPATEDGFCGGVAG